MRNMDFLFFSRSLVKQKKVISHVSVETTVGLMVSRAARSDKIREEALTLVKASLCISAAIFQLGL